MKVLIRPELTQAVSKESKFMGSDVKTDKYIGQEVEVLEKAEWTAIGSVAVAQDGQLLIVVTVGDGTAFLSAWNTWEDEK